MFQPVRGSSLVLTSLAASKVRDQFCAALSSQPSVVSGCMDFNIDHSSIRAINLDMGPSRSPGLDITMFVFLLSLVGCLSKLLWSL